MTLIKTLASNVALRKWAYNISGFRKYGLRRDDLLHEYPEVEEAIRRLPKRTQEERIFRLIRAAQLECQHRVLPEEQWTKFEEDELYLTPLVKEVRREKAERESYDAM
ncbi:cytochrome b-c1 complex subunit 7 [Lasioglossum baleicum]|uniref:cytochrome b-c1 complex subunit 7 n=1 Tax=Lasioglossum baleicum TaxID=434251 RepID=UPI003FCECCD8